jgi:hypothetical protein
MLEAFWSGVNRAIIIFLYLWGKKLFMTNFYRLVRGGLKSRDQKQLKIDQGENPLFPQFLQSG